MYDPQGTIVALSSAPGPGARAVVRLTGANCWSAAQTCFRSEQPLPESIHRGRWQGLIELSEFNGGIPAEIFVWAAPKTYTGQDLIEIHTLSSPPIIEVLIAHLMGNGARAAQPGEFTMRAFLAGKLDLTQAEAVLGIIEAGSQDELKTALGQLAGGMARPLQELRDGLLDILAEVEAGLDFSEEDLQFISRDQLLRRLDDARQTLQQLLEQLQERSISGQPFRIALAGPANAGKSSLFNALVGKDAAMVSPEAGTTRDYLVQRVCWDGIEIELIDTAGTEKAKGDRRKATGKIAAQAQLLREEQVEAADLVLLCHDVSENAITAEEAPQGESIVAVGTKSDLISSRLWPLASRLLTSAATGEGLNDLRSLLVTHARRARRSASLAPSWSRCRHHVETGIAHLHHAEEVVQHRAPPELLALELRLALGQLGEMAGAVYTDDLLDRIFGHFCIGK